MSMIAKNRTKSTWTPLSNEETNNKIFEERKTLIGKWYDKWSNEQRKKVLEEIVKHSKVKQLHFAQKIIAEKVPTTSGDFTRELPRVVSLYIFSFLDPRSLCRCARVCWHWKYITELDQLWMPKCLRLSWYLPFTPSPYETGVWKRNYIENIRTLQVLQPKNLGLLELEKLKLDKDRRPKSSRDNNKSQIKPWRGSDPVPKDTWRYNVLENDDVVGDISKIRKKKSYGGDVEIYNKMARSKIKTGHHILNQTRKSQSMSKLLITDPSSTQRPQWAQSKNNAPYVSFDDSLMNMVPRPVTSPPPKQSKPATARSDRDPPTARLFPEQPWRVPTSEDSDNEH